MGLKKCQLLWCFHTSAITLCLRLLPMLMTALTTIASSVLATISRHERLVHLHSVDGKSSQIAQAEIAGAKVINGQSHTDGLS